MPSDNLRLVEVCAIALAVGIATAIPIRLAHRRIEQRRLTNNAHFALALTAAVVFVREDRYSQGRHLLLMLGALALQQGRMR
jgi:hypothetical protein